MEQAALLVPGLLESPVPGDLIRVRRAMPLPVAGILGAPLLRAVIADLAVNRICGDLAPMVFPPSALLTFRCRADNLLRMESGRVEKALAEQARPLAHSSRVPRSISTG